MPVLSHSDLSQDDLNTDIRAEDTIDITPDRSDLSTLGEEVAASFRVENDVTSFLTDETKGVDNSPQEGFDIFSEIEGTEFEPHAEAFLNVFNPTMLEVQKQKVRRELKDRELLGTTGLSGMGWAFVAGMLSPTNLVPGGLAVKGVKQGYSVGKSAGNVAVAGGISTALAEGVLQSTQELRTPEESLLNIAAGTTFSGAFGGGLAYLANRGIKGRYAGVLDEAAGFDPTFRTRLDKATPEQQADLLAEANEIIIKAKTEEIDRMAKLSEEFKARVDGVDDIGAKIDELYAETRAYSSVGDLGTSDLGAAKTAKTLDDLTLRGKAARAYTGASKYLHPYTRMMSQPSPWAREMAANLFENNLILKMHETEALNSAVETNVKRWADARLASALEDIGFDGKRGIYKEMRQAGHNMPLAEYRELVAKALRRNDGNAVDSDGNDLGIPTGQFNPYIMKAAKKVRDDVLEKGREELNKIGRTLESKKSKTAASYLTRVWNRKKLKEKEAEFKDRNGPVWKYLEKALNSSIDKAAKRLETRIKNLESEIHELEDAARRRDAEYKERTGVSIRELEELEQINQRLVDLEEQLARGPQIDPQAAEAFGQDFLESFNRMLPPQLRLDIVDEIGGPPRPKKDYNPAIKEAAKNVIDDIADSGEIIKPKRSREIAQADTPEGKAEIETYGAVGSKEWAKNKAAEARRAKQNTKTINVKDDDGTLFNLKEDYLSEDGLSSKEFVDLLHRHPVKAMMFHSLDDGKTWYDPAGLMEQRNLLTSGVDPEELTLPEIATIDKIDAFLESLPERVYTEDGALRSVNPYGKFSFEPITRNESQSGDLLHNFDLLNDGRVEVHEAPEVLAAEHGIGSGYEMFVRAKGNDGAPDVRLLVEREVHDADEVGGSIIEFEVGTKAGEKLVYDWDNDGFLDAVSEELFDFGLIKTFDSEFEPLGLSRLSVFDDSLEALGPEHRASFVSVDGKFYSTLGSLDYIKKLPDDPQFEILKHNAEISDYMSYAARVEPEKLLERFAGRTTFEPPKNQPLLEKSLDTIENDPDGFSTDMADDVYYQNGATNAQGSFNPKENLIQIVKNAVDPQGSGQHELIHGLRSLKLLQDDEWALLEQSAKELDWLGKHNIQERYKNTYLDRPDQRANLMLEEAVAEEFAKWRQGQLEVTPEVQTVFEKILTFLQNIADSLRARGIESYDDVFELIESGDIAARGKQQLIDEAAQLGGRKQQLEAQAQHAQQNELEPGLLPEDVTNALKILNDKEKPKRPQTLRQFIVREGGLLEQDGELKYRGWTNKTHPNLVKDVFIRDQVDAFNGNPRGSQKDGWTLDEMTQRAWEEGFFDERPSVSDMLDALSDDMSGEFHVRGEDEQALSLFQDRMALEEELDRLGINPAKQRHLLHTDEGERDLIAAVGRVMNSQDEKKITKLRKKIDDAEFKRMSIPEKNDADEVGEIVRSVYSKLMGDDIKDDFLNENIIDFGFLKGRTFGIRDELVEQYLENDIEAVLRSYVRNISGQVEMQKRFGSMDLAPHLSKIADEFETARFKILKDKKLNDQQKQKEVEKLWKQKADVERSLKFIRDKILGRYQHDVDVNLWTRTLDGAMQVQYMMALGGVVASSLADVWRAPMTQGMGRFFGGALPQLIAANKTLKLNRELAKKWAGIAEITNNSRLAHLIGLHDPYIQQSPAEVAVSKMTSNFSKLTGMPYWNQFWKEFSGAIVIDRALGNLNKGIDNISPKERRWLNEAGFGALSSHMPTLRSSGAVEKIQGVWTINPDKFPPQLVDQFWGGVKKEIDRTIITPGFGDLPIRMHHPLGKAALQFKSFGFAADQKMTMRGMQDDMANTLAGIMGMTTVGMFIYMLKSLEAGREIDENPMTWLTEGLDRSGAFFVFFEANNMFEKMGGPGVYYGVGARAPASRFATRNTVAGLAGPLFGSATDTAQLIGSGLSLLHPGREADATPGDIAAIRRLTPYASLPAWRWAIDNYLVPELKEGVQ